MDHLKLRLLVAGLTLCGSTALFAQYKYVAPDGTVTFSDQPPQSDARHISVQPLPAQQPVLVAAALPYELSLAASNFPVTLYTGPQCDQCDQARSYLKQRGVLLPKRLSNKTPTSWC